MLSYQHSFHAANHADLLKHACLCAILEKLLQKPKPFFCLDTHSGSGAYSLGEKKQDENEVEKYTSANYNQTSFSAFLEIADEFRQFNRYPGSASLIPAFIERYLLGMSSVSDEKKEELLASYQIHLNELHPSVFESLKSEMKHHKVHIHNRDGFELLNALMPPKPNRGMVLIDPPYEQAGEYNQVLKSLIKAQKKWLQGIFALWYPLLSSTRINRKTKHIEANPKYGLSENLINQIVGTLETGIINVRWAKYEPTETVGMYGSGMLLINPPFRIEEQLRALLDILVVDASDVCQELSYVEILKTSN